MFTQPINLFGILVSLGEMAGLSALMFTACIAFWKGGSLERRVVSLVALAWVGSIIVDMDSVRGVQWGIFAIDVALAAWLLGEAISIRRIWIIFAAAVQLMIVLTHVVFALNPLILHEGFFSAYYVWSYAVLLLIVIGSITSPRPVGDDPSQKDLQG